MTIFKSIITAAALIMSATAVQAVDSSDRGLGANQRTLGFTSTDSITYTDVMVGTAGTYTMGAMLPASTLEPYKGCRVVGIRMAAAHDLGRSTFHLLEGEKGNVKQLVEQKQRIYEGWNNLFFNGDGFEISGTAPLFYAFDYTETPEMVENEKGGLCTVGDEYADSFLLYQDGEFLPVTGAGQLCIQLIVDVSALPAVKVAIPYFDTGFKYKKRGENVEIFSILKNVGREAIKGLTLAVTLDNGTPVMIERNDTLQPEEELSVEYAYQIPEGTAAGSHNISIRAERANGQAIAAGENAEHSASFAIYDKSLQRNKSYLEVYADQDQYYTAMLDEHLDAVKDKMGDNVEIVKTFRPGNSLCAEGADWLHDTYAYTWPCFTANRAYYPGEAYIAYDVNQYLETVPFIVPEVLCDIAGQDLSTPSFAGIEMVQMPETGDMGTAMISVTGELLDEAASIYGDLALTVMVVSDEAVAKQMVVKGNRAQYDNNYVHSNTLISFLSAPKGDKIDNENGRFHRQYSYQAPAGVDIHKCRAVAILTKDAAGMTTDNLKDYDIINCASLHLTDGSDVNEITDETIAPALDTEWFTIDGRPAGKNPTAKGIYVSRTGKKILY